MSESLENNYIKLKIRINNQLERIDRFIRKKFKIHSIRNMYFMKTLPSEKKTQKIVKKMFQKQAPFLLIRFGLYEHMLCYQYLEKQNGLRKSYSDFIKEHIALDAGLFFEEEKELDRYANNVLENLDKVDIMAYWRNIPSPFVFKRFYKKDLYHIDIEKMYPFPFWNEKYLPDWQLLLEGKRILIVSSFAKTIESQYAKRDKIWQEKSILPEFELKVYQAVVTNGGIRDNRFEKWVDALEWMVNDILNIEFDIAFLSCGAYGIPLAMELKKHGRSAIQWGGCFQLWFGILGNRWDDNCKILKYVNKEWTYPLREEVPPMAVKVNDCAYWKKENT